MAVEQGLPFHRKFRPNTLLGYIGNEKLKRKVLALLSAVVKPQVILISGPSGTGKTTLARLIGKDYLCENRDDVTGACGECYTCRMMDDFIATGKSDVLTNIREVDATGEGNKQNITDLLEDASSPSFDGNWKVYIIDECHAIPPSAQDRLLKFLEEPAENVLMLLCTTNPEVLKDTIKSRCQYELKVQKPTKEELIGLLQTVCKQEGVQWEKRALGLICAKGEFVPRKALTALEEVIREAQEVTYDSTVKVLSLIADKYFFKFFEILLSKHIDAHRYICFIGKVKEEMDLKYFLESLLAFTLRGLYVLSGHPVDALDKVEIEQYKDLFSKFNESDLSYWLDTLVSMKSSGDVEAKLLNLGYKGIFRPKVVVQEQQQVSQIELIDTAAYSPKEEKAMGDKNYQESITMSEEEKEQRIQDYNKVVNIDDIARMFGGTKVIDVIPE